jgi:DNA-binding SARP family transcriptional activator
MHTAPGICLSLLGRFCLYLGAREITAPAFKSRKALSLLKLLAITPPQQLHRDQGMEVLWPELDPEAAASQMYKAIHYIRKVFDTAQSTIASDALLVYRNEVLQLTAPAAVHTDVEAFQQRAQDARRTKSVAAYQRAVACYTGDLLPADIYASWSDELRESLRRQFVELLMALGQKYNDAGYFADAADAFRRVLAIDSLDERAHQGLMRAFALQGSRSQALHQYKRCKEIVAKELGVTPSAATVALVQEIREDKLQPPAEVATLPKIDVAKTLLALPKHRPLIGRQHELAQVATLFDTVAAGKGEVLILQGIAGIGKTLLAQEMLHLEQLRGYHTLLGSAYEQEKDMPYSPAIEALRMAMRLSPDLAPLIPAELAAGIPELRSTPPAASATHGAAAQNYLFAGVLRCLKALAEQSPVVMILEDVHFADEDTLKLFHYLVRNAVDLPLFLAGTCRPLEPATSPTVVTLLEALERRRSAHIFALPPPRVLCTLWKRSGDGAYSHLCICLLR